MRSILHKIVLAPVVMAAAALATNSAMAEARVNVPFKFNVAGKECPAGPYMVIEDTTHNRVTLWSRDAPLSFTWLIGAGDPAPGDNKVILRFDATGENYVLRTVQYHSLITPRLDKHVKGSEHMPVRMIEGQ